MKQIEQFIKDNNITDQEVSSILENSLTPYILEERKMNVTQMDVFSRLMKDRIIWISGPVNERMCDIVQAQLLFLDSMEVSDIKLYLNTPGGSVIHGLGIVDTMNLIKSDVQTINCGMCASMGSVLLSSGAKGKRFSLKHSRVMTHQVSYGAQGNAQDIRITVLEAEKSNFLLFKILAKNTGKTFDEIIEMSSRDRWFNSDESMEHGLVDEVLLDEGDESISQMMEGFDEYYKNYVISKAISK